MMRMRTAVIGATMLTGVALGATAARAADDGYQNVFSSVVTAVGIMKADEQPEIEYRERAPLVLPPKMDLPPPSKSGLGRTAAWPNDPDVVRRQKAAEAARAPLPDLLGNSTTLLSRDEMAKGRKTTTASKDPEPDNCGVKHNQRGCLVLSPDQLRAEGERATASGFFDKKPDQLEAGVEPERMYLTQPPKGYLKTSKTVKATAEAPVPVIDQSNPNSNLVYRKKDDDE